MKLEKKVYNLKELAELFQLNHRTLAVNVTRRPETLPKFVKIGGSIRFTATAILEFIGKSK